MMSSLQTKEDKADQSESGFYCEVCDCIVKDSLNYLDHVNGKRHNRNLGISLKKFTDSTLEEVKEMLEFKKRQREDKALGLTVEERDKEEEERWRKLKREKKKRQKARRSGMDAYDDDDDDDDDEDDDAEKDEDDGDEEEDEAEGEEEGGNNGGDDDVMAKMMGFSSFSTSKK